MIVDQADSVAARAVAHAQGGRRHVTPDHRPDHPHRAGGLPPLAGFPHTDPVPGGDRPAGGDDPAVRPGLRGCWPAPHAGTPRTARCVLRAEPASPGRARDFTAATLAGWSLAEHSDDAVIAVSELVTNALRHGLREVPHGPSGGLVQLVLLNHPRRLVVMVTDPGERVPEPVAHEPEWFGEGGRGLLVVGAVSSAWGWAPLTTGGKAVWAAFELRRPARDEAVAAS
ncbi:ATP-binding protein [Actinomadura hibisca]|uniref:ATP-binding protein n=1 Tax=Actinomadura hibisca TaxID=68565 RepID=UPI000A0088CA|nr:ATP-binding protein [Actinomadura hibisca]